eukprot:gb/GECH01008150.1/.p1 GENE.gb/GECH01008150.1/~~gb/GECH01008150.1/.p1  ORF type:complete len:355 (+),score=84.37 gb/GECH01008150.1/:1-1065(+)
MFKNNDAVTQDIREKVRDLIRKNSSRHPDPKRYLNQALNQEANAFQISKNQKEYFERLGIKAQPRNRPNPNQSSTMPGNVHMNAAGNQMPYPYPGAVPRNQLHPQMPRAPQMPAAGRNNINDNNNNNNTTLEKQNDTSETLPPTSEQNNGEIQKKPPPPKRGTGSTRARVRVRVRVRKPRGGGTATAGSTTTSRGGRGQPPNGRGRVRVRVRGRGRGRGGGQNQSKTEQEEEEKQKPVEEMTPAEQSVVASGAEKIMKKGALTKRGHVRTNWTRRFFVLSDKALHYFKDQNEKKSKGKIELAQAEFIEETQKTKDYVFSVTENKGKKTFIQAPSQDEYKEWVDVIPKAIEKASN